MKHGKHHTILNNELFLNKRFRKLQSYSTAVVLGFNNMSTLVGHFVWSPREREKRDSREDENEEQGRKRNRNESEETEIKTFPLYPYLLYG